MGFDLNKFKTTNHDRRTAIVPVPELKDFFGDGDAPEVTVQNLSASEYGHVMEAVQRNNIDNLRRLMGVVGAGDTNGIVEGLKEYLEATYGEDGELPADIVKRIYLIKYGMVEPKLDHQNVVRLGEFHTEPFYRISEKIKDLTALGSVPNLGE